MSTALEIEQQDGKIPRSRSVVHPIFRRRRAGTVGQRKRQAKLRSVRESISECRLGLQGKSNSRRQA
jgi:hypothetical protein